MEVGEAAGRVRRLLGPMGILGAALVLGAVLVLVLNFVLPWLVVHPGSLFGAPSFPTETLDRDDVKDGPLEYTTQLVDWALAGLVIMVVAGAALVALAVVPPRGDVVAVLGALIAALAGFGGFLLALTGCRWLGVLIENQLAPGDPLITLHAVPYLNMAFGAGVLAVSGWQLNRDLAALLREPPRGRLSPVAWRVPLASVTIVAVALLALPLIPYTVNEGPGGDRHAGEYAYAVLAQYDDDGGQGGDAGRDLGWARLMLWLVGYVSLAATGAAVIERRGHDFLTWGTLAQVHALAAIPLVIGLVFVVLSYVHLAGLDDATITFNHVLPLAFIILAVLALVWAREVLVAYAETVELTAADEP